MQTLAKTCDKHYLIPKSFLQSGKPLQITKNIYCKHPTIQEIFDIDVEHFGLHSEEIYYSMIGLFQTDPYVYMVFLDDHGIDYETTNSFDVFVLLYSEYINKIISLQDEMSKDQISYLLHNNIYTRTFNFFFGIDDFYIANDEDGDTVIAYGNGNFLFDKDTFKYIEEFIKRINGMPEIDKIYPEDNMAKQILLEDERTKLKKKENKEQDENEHENISRLGDLLSNITWVSNGSITPFNRTELHVYDLIDAFYKTDKYLNYQNTMTGLYSGCIDKKSINMNEIHWSK